MQNRMKELYNEEYYRQRAYEFDTRYPFFNIIAGTLVVSFNPQQTLDVGCAKGYLVYALRELGVQAYGVDISEYAISQSPESVRDFLANVDVDFENLPFAPETFDMVTALECIEHLQNHNNLISEISRVLKPGGFVLIMIPKRHWDNLQQLVTAPNPSHINMHSKSFWIQTFKSHGFVYAGSLPGEVQRRARSAWKSAARETVASNPPGKIGKYLFKFGKFGKWLRDELASAMILLPSEVLLFRLYERDEL